MKIGLISDIHGNMLALEKTLEEFQKRKITHIFCGGDIIGLGPYPEEVVQRLMAYPNVVCIQGNHEGYLTNRIPEFIHGRPIREEEINHHRWVHQMLSSSSKEYIQSLQNVAFFEIEGIKIYMTHYPSTQEGVYKDFYKFPTDQELVSLFQDIDADVYLYGHTHVQNIKCIGGKWFVNMGALGCPLKENDIVASILTIENKKVSIEPLKISYDARSC